MPSEIDPITGHIRKVNGCLNREGFCYHPRMASGEAIVLYFTELPAEADPRFEACDPVKELGSFTLRPDRQFIIGEEHYESRILKGETQPAVLGDWRPLLGEDFSGEAEYLCEFTLSAKEAEEAKCLSLGDVRYSCSVELNGVNLGCLFTSPFAVETSGSLREGKNTLRIILANTAANQFVYTKVFDKFTPAQLGRYHIKTVPFEPNLFLPDYTDLLYSTKNDFELPEHPLRNVFVKITET